MDRAARKRMRSATATGAPAAVATTSGARSRVAHRAHRQGGNRHPIDEPSIIHVSAAPQPAQKRALGAAAAPHWVQWDALGAASAVPQLAQNFDPGAFGA